MEDALPPLTCQEKDPGREKCHVLDMAKNA